MLDWQITESENESSSPFYPFVIFAFSSFLDFHHFYTSAGQTCIAVVSKSKIDEEKLSSGTNDDYPDLSNHVGIGTLRYCHHHKPLLYSKNFAKLFSTQRHASSCGDVLGLCVPFRNLDVHQKVGLTRTGFFWRFSEKLKPKNLKTRAHFEKKPQAFSKKLKLSEIFEQNFYIFNEVYYQKWI